VKLPGQRCHYLLREDPTQARPSVPCEKSRYVKT